MKNIFICLFILIISFMIGCSKQIDEVSISKDDTTNIIESDYTVHKWVEGTQTTIYTTTTDTTSKNAKKTTAKIETFQTTTNDTKKSIDTSKSTSNTITKASNNQTIVETSTLTEITISTIEEDNSIELPQIPIE